jgi:hypothetical protein
MPGVGFEPAIPVFERAKTVQALDRAATVIGQYIRLYLRGRIPHSKLDVPCRAARQETF